MKLILKYILWFPWEMGSSGFGFNSSFELKPKERKERIYQCVLGGCPCSVRKWATGSLQRSPGLRIDMGGKRGWGGHPWSLPFFIFFFIFSSLLGWNKSRDISGNATKSSASTRFEVLPFGSQSPNCKGLGASCTSSGLLRSRGWWPRCGMVTHSSFPLGTSTATTVAHCALQWAAQRLKWTSNRFIMLFSVWSWRHRQRLNPSHYSWGSNARHSSSGVPRDLGCFAKHKRDRVTESYS